MVSASNTLGGHLSARRRVLSFPFLQDATWIAADETQPGYADRSRRSRLLSALGALRRNPEWRLVFEQDGHPRLPPLDGIARAARSRTARARAGRGSARARRTAEREEVRVMENQICASTSARAASTQAAGSRMKTNGISHTRYWGEKKRVNARKAGNRSGERSRGPVGAGNDRAGRSTPRPQPPAPARRCSARRARPAASRPGRRRSRDLCDAPPSRRRGRAGRPP